MRENNKKVAATPLDDALLGWCEEFRDLIAPSAQRNASEWLGGPKVELSLNAHAMHLELAGLEKHGISVVERDVLKGERFGAFISLLRNEMPASGWPLRLRLELAGRHGLSVEPVGIGVCGKLFGQISGERSNDLVTPRRRSVSYYGVCGLDRLVAGMRLVSAVAPASNRPIGSWSSGNDLMGTAHIHVEGVHARTETEFFLKQALFRLGLSAFREAILEGGFEPLPNSDRRWFVVTELEALDRHPLGVSRKFTDAAAEINERLAYLRDEDLEP